MGRQARRYFADRDSDASVSESEQEEELEFQVEEEEEHEDNRAKEEKKTPITIVLKKVCKVCKQVGHEAGFKGATYIDCPKKPCFLCKQPGHTTMTCPHRIATEHGVAPAPRRHILGPFDFVYERQIKNHINMIKPTYVIPTQVDCAIKLHSRRVTCLEFHPTKNNILISGDKKGEIGIWDYEKVLDTILYDSVHSCIVNNIKFHPVNSEFIYTSGSDGTISCTDIETGLPVILMDLNPDGWNGPATWRMLYGMDINPEKDLLLVADNFGLVYQIDMRSNKKTGEPVLIHKKGSKVVGLHFNPVHPDLLISCGNDHFVRLWDIRQLKAGACLAELAHPRVVNSAYFSPRTGTKIMTTCQDNRIRVWDSIFGDLNFPSREIVHSHDFNRHLTCFRAEWDPKDPSECLAVIGRYISNNFNGVALHPIDFIDTSNGQLVAEVADPDIATITPVNKFHPRKDLLASGSSRSLLIWCPKEEIDSDEMIEERKHKVSPYTVLKGKRPKGKLEDDDEDDNFTSKKKSKLNYPSFKTGTCSIAKRSK
ncbi:hypothetical protein SUGI_0397090 [Cryptomeria japonica]|uniref:protein DAMAGED DNA-BINDING 2 n=1 Tax=Cryptomeria japonica TaxID=3369 RepID=UPI002408AD81|nr:protein DAMAGED DNA-BINDING 2 [Cryptomeria japonica]GLJ21497.1 hypothetical protein SUGI_0397090 [Cryptomeria japonica]